MDQAWRTNRITRWIAAGAVAVLLVAVVATVLVVTSGPETAPASKIEKMLEDSAAEENDETTVKCPGHGVEVVAGRTFQCAITGLWTV